MTLDLKQTDRSYLFGRLLACADQAETLALLKDARKNKQNSEEDGKEDADGDNRVKIRQTNAVRLMQAFGVRPASTWRYLEEQLNKAYYAKLKDNGSYFVKLITEIFELLESNAEKKGFTNDRLEDVYLLGYHLQLAELRRAREKTEKNVKTSENKAAAETAGNK